MLDHSKNVVVSGSLTVVHGNFIAYGSDIQNAEYLTNDRAGIQGMKVLFENMAAGAMHNSKERYDAPKCHPDTRNAVLGDITSWVSDHSKNTLILWLSAPAGSGKSAILQQIAEIFHNPGGLSASFFFSRTATMRNTEAFLIATLAFQLAISIPATRSFIEGAIERDPSIFSRVLSEQMTRLVVQPLVHASLHPENGPSWPTLLVIDGLDECRGEEHQADILRILRTALLQLKYSLPTLYLVIASRPEPAITTIFDDEVSSITHRIVLDDAYHPDRDIAVFLRSSFADIYRRRHARFPSMASLPRPWPSEHIISFLVRKSSGQFIFAATVIRFIDVDRKIPTAQLQLILDICKSMDSSRFSANPFALLDGLYNHVLNSSEETEQVISVLGAIFYLNTKQSPTLELLRALLRLEPEDVTILFWDLHSIVHVPITDKDPIRFYHASLRDFLMDQHRSGPNLYINGSNVHLFLRERTVLALDHNVDYWISHYISGDRLDPGFLDKVLEELNLETWLSLDQSANATAFNSWWDTFTLLRDRFHSRCDLEKCSALCCRYTSILDRYLVHRFQKHREPTVAAAFMWLTLLGPPGHIGDEFIMRDAEWLWGIWSCASDRFQFLDLLMHFLSDHERSSNIFVGSAISTSHFAHLCAQKAWRGILALGHPFGSENRRMLIYLYDVLNLLLPGATHERGSGLTDETISQYIQMRIDNLADLVRFVEGTGRHEVCFEDQVSQWRYMSMMRETNSSANFTMAVFGNQNEVETSPARVKPEGQPSALLNKGRKPRRIITVRLTDPNYKTVIEHVPAQCE